MKAAVYAELRAVPESFCWPIPPGLVHRRGGVRAGRVRHRARRAVGVRPPAGRRDGAHPGRCWRVGIAAIQLAKRAGARVLATASSDGKLARLAELGLDHGINYRTTDFGAKVRHLTSGHGADVILDGVGGQVLADSLRCLAYRGRCVSFGDAGRQHDTPLDVSGLRPGNQSLTGYFLGAEMIAGHRAHGMIAGLLDDVAAGQLRAVIDRSFPLAEAAAAHAYAESRQAFGRVLLKP